jgi:exonuclease VII large subunit
MKNEKEHYGHDSDQDTGRDVDELIDQQLQRLDAQLERLEERIQGRIAREINRISRHVDETLPPEAIGDQTERLIRDMMTSLESRINPETIGKQAEEAVRQAREHLERVNRRMRTGRSPGQRPRQPDAGPTDEEVATILRMVESGKISAEEASELLGALD